MKKYFIVGLLLTTTYIFGLDNQQKVDSLLKILPTVKSDTGKITLLLNIANTYRNFETKNALQYSNQAFNLAKKIENDKKLYECYITKGLINYRLGNNKEATSNYLTVINNTDNDNLTKAKAYLNLGNLYADLGKYDSSIVLYKNANVIFQRTGNKKESAGVLNNIGTVYSDLGDYDKAINYYTQSLKAYKEYGNILGSAAATENIGVIYYFQKNYNKALEYFNKALTIFEEVGVLEKQAHALSNIASMEIIMENNDAAINHFSKAEEIFDKLNNKVGQAEIAQNLSQLYININKPNKGLKSLNKALSLYKELKNIKGEGVCYEGLGTYYFNAKKYSKSIENYLKAEKLLEPLGVKNNLRNLYYEIADAYSYANQHNKAVIYLSKYIAINDTMFNFERSNQIAEMQEKYDSEVKQQEIELQQIEIAKQNAEVALQTKQKIWYGVGMVLTIILLLIAFRGYKQKQKSNTIITNQKDIVEEKNREIIDSINYAKRIQNALLSSEEHESKHLPKHFIFFNPKDIVSGDFYWTFEKQNYLYLAVADCTGHGVPGAFLTMLGTAFLNEITAREDILSPAEILDELRAKIIKELNQTGAEGENKDGMDISLIRLDIKTKELEWAGANNPLWLVKNNLEKEASTLQLNISIDDKHLYEIKSDKQPISYYPDSKPFTNHKVKLEKEDSIYLFTDGYADQFGGPKGKKFKYRPFKNLLISLSNKSMAEQKETLEKNFIQWKGDLEQIDDVCVIGLKI